jgi:hypothetical protein
MLTFDTHERANTPTFIVAVCSAFDITARRVDYQEFNRGSLPHPAYASRRTALNRKKSYEETEHA